MEFIFYDGFNTIEAKYGEKNQVGAGVAPVPSLSVFILVLESYADVKSVIERS